MTEAKASQKTRRWNTPRPNAFLMRVLGVANRWFLLRGLPGVRGIPGVRDLPFLRGYFRVRHIEIPDADLARLRNAVNPGTVAFIGPNHPEFATDWMIDKEISTLVAPLMASWADKDMVNAAPGFWGRNNLIANDGGDAARAYSVEWALKGRGVLLHPEGTVHWTNDFVHPLFPGIAQMAVEAAAQTDKPVFIVPIVWKYRYVEDVSTALVREIGVLERELHLQNSSGDLARRFQAINENLLSARMKHFGYANAVEGDFFARQEGFLAWLIRDLETRHVVEASDDDGKRVARLTRAIRVAARENRSPQLEHDLAMASEAKRVHELARVAYGGRELTQEQISESLKRMRDRLLKRGLRDNVANLLPRPFGARIVHVGVPEPIRVPTSAPLSVDSLLVLTRSRMQETLDSLLARPGTSKTVLNFLIL